jgi:hypothetical protein
MLPFAAALGKVEGQLMQAGYRIQWDVVVKRAWRRLVGEGAESVIVPMPNQTPNPAQLAQALGGLIPGAGGGPPAVPATPGGEGLA